MKVRRKGGTPPSLSPQQTALENLKWTAHASRRPGQSTFARMMEILGRNRAELMQLLWSSHPDLSEADLQRVASSGQRTVQEVTTALPWEDQRQVTHINLRYMLSSISSQQRKDLRHVVGVHDVTISRWKNRGGSSLQVDHATALTQFFQLPFPFTERLLYGLLDEPLSGLVERRTHQLSQGQTRKVLRQALDRMPDQELLALLPALAKLLDVPAEDTY